MYFLIVFIRVNAKKTVSDNLGDIVFSIGIKVDIKRHKLSSSAGLIEVVTN